MLSVVEHSLAGVRARYVQPYEDAMLHNGVFLLDVKIERIERSGDGFRVRMSRTDGRVALKRNVVLRLDDLRGHGKRRIGIADDRRRRRGCRRRAAHVFVEVC